MDVKSIKLNIKREARNKGISIETLCSRMKVNRNYINRINNGTPIWKFKQIADAIGCELQDLFCGEK